MSAWCMACGDSARACFAGQRIVSSHLADNTLLQNYTTVLEIIMRLRMICDHADLVAQDAPQDAAQASFQAAASHPELVQRLISVLKVRAIWARLQGAEVIWPSHCALTSSVGLA